MPCYNPVSGCRFAVPIPLHQDWATYQFENLHLLKIIFELWKRELAHEYLKNTDTKMLGTGSIPIGHTLPYNHIYSRKHRADKLKTSKIVYLGHF